jgi:predicted nuclease with TOPRIM domain
LENTVKTELVAKVKEKVAELPKMLYDLAKHRESEDDLDGAGELYFRFLEITPDNKSPERAHAADFLRESFDLHPQAITVE